MVQAVENWCCVVGTIVKLSADSASSKGKPDQVTLTIRVAAIEPVDGYPTLIRTTDVPSISVTASRAQLGSGKIGERRVSVPVRVAAPDRYFAHPDWSLAHGSPMCGAEPT